MSVYRRLRIAAVALWIMLLLGAILLWAAALNGSAPSSQLAASRYNGGSMLFVAGLVVIALRHVRPRRRMGIVIAAILLATLVAPLRAEPVLESRPHPDGVMFLANGSGYGSGGGPISQQGVVDGRPVIIQVHPTLEFTRKHVGRGILVRD